MEPKINIFINDDFSNDPLLVAKNASDIMFYVIMGSSFILDGVSYLSKSANQTFDAWFKSSAPVQSKILPKSLFSQSVNGVANSYDPFFVAIHNEGANKDVAASVGHLVQSSLVQGLNNMTLMSEHLVNIHNRKRLKHNGKLPLLAVNSELKASNSDITTAAAQATAASTLNKYSAVDENITTLDLEAWDGNYTYQQSRKETHFTHQFSKLVETLDNLGINYAMDLTQSRALHTDPIDQHTFSYLKTFLAQKTRI
jgi:hypothetical protein